MPPFAVLASRRPPVPCAPVAGQMLQAVPQARLQQVDRLVEAPRGDPGADEAAVDIECGLRQGGPLQRWIWRPVQLDPGGQYRPGCELGELADLAPRICLPVRVDVPVHRHDLHLELTHRPSTPCRDLVASAGPIMSARPSTAG